MPAGLGIPCECRLGSTIDSLVLVYWRFFLFGMSIYILPAFGRTNRCYRPMWEASIIYMC